MATKHKPIIEATTLDWARLAAFIDGEGSIFIGLQKYISRNTQRALQRTFIGVMITNTDVRLFTWLQERFSGCVSPMASKNPKWTPGYQWRVTEKEAMHVLENCLEYFVLKRNQAEIAIAHQKLRAPSGTPIGEEIFAQRLNLRDQLSMLKNPATRRKDLRDQPTIQ